MSTREKYEAALQRYHRAGEDFQALCPPQTEMLTGELWVSWEPRTWPQNETGFTMRLHPQFGDMPPASLRRLADIREALDAWRRNEAPWPLSKNPPTKEMR